MENYMISFIDSYQYTRKARYKLSTNFAEHESSTHQQSKLKLAGYTNVFKSQ